MGIQGVSGMPIGQGKSIYRVSFEGKERAPRVIKIDIAVLPSAETPLLFHHLVMVIEKDGKFLARVSEEMEKQLKQVGTPLVFEGQEINYDLMDEKEAQELKKIFDVAAAVIGTKKTAPHPTANRAAPQPAVAGVDGMDKGYFKMVLNHVMKHGRNFIEEIKRQVLDRWNENVQKEKEQFIKSSKEIREKKDIQTHELANERIKKEAVASEQKKIDPMKVESKDE